MAKELDLGPILKQLARWGEALDPRPIGIEFWPAVPEPECRCCAAREAFLTTIEGFARGVRDENLHYTHCVVRAKHELWKQASEVPNLWAMIRPDRRVSGPSLNRRLKPSGPPSTE